MSQRGPAPTQPIVKKQAFPLIVLKIRRRASGLYWKCLCICSMWYKPRLPMITALCLLNKADGFVLGLNKMTRVHMLL